MRQQVILMDKIAFSPDHDVVRKSMRIPGAFKLRALLGPTKRCRPRMRWPAQVLHMRIRSAGSYEQFLSCWHFEHSSFAAWRFHVRRVCKLIVCVSSGNLSRKN